MDPSGRVRRYFIGVATTSAPACPDLEDRPELSAEAGRMAELFTGRLGYAAVPGFGTDLSKDDLRARLRAFLTDPDRRASDIVAFYYTGHGLLDGDELMLPMHDATADVVGTALWIPELTKWLLRGTAAQRFLIVLDTCFASVGGADAARAGVEYLARLRGIAEDPAVAVIAAARPHEQAESGAFTRAFVGAVDSHASGGHEPEYVPLDAIVNMVNVGTPAWQHARLFAVGDGVHEFLPNPRFDRWLRDLDLRTQRDRVQRRAREAERASHVLPRAQGLDRPRDGLWLFTGREAVLRALSEWLRDKDSAPVLVVTGDPGSGKSAVLSRLHVLADARLRNRVPGLGELPAGLLPPVGAIARFIHARGQTPQQVLGGLCEAAGVDVARTAGDLLAALARRAEPVTVVIDALDEASTASAGSHPLVEELLAPLIQGAGRVPLRLLLGTRRNLLKSLGNPQTIDLDDPVFADPEGTVRYAERCLTRLVTPTPYRAGEPLTGDVASAIAEAAGSSYLVAQTTARSLALRDTAVDPTDSVWRQRLPSEAADAMRIDLEDRLGAEAGRARDLLLPLAYAQGAGLPWEDLWTLLASALAGKPYTDDDIDWLIDQAGYYVVESAWERRSVYRLYHETLAEHLRQGRDTAADHRAIAEALTRHTPHLYTWTHLSTHAARGGVLDPLLADPHFLLSAEQTHLLAALRSAQTPEGRVLSDVYRRAAHHLRGKPPAERASYLELAARCGHTKELARAVNESGLPMPWRTAWVSWRLPQQHQTFTGHLGDVTALATAELGGRPVIVSGSIDLTVRVWDLATGQTVGAPCVGHDGAVTAVAVTDGTIVSGDQYGGIRLWDLATRAPLGGAKLPGFWRLTSVAAATWRGTKFVVAGSGSGVHVWDPSTGELRTLELLSGVRGVAVAEVGGAPVVVAAGVGMTSAFDPTTLAALGPDMDGMSAIACGEFAGRPVAAGLDGADTVVWDLATREKIASYPSGYKAQAFAVSTWDGRAVGVYGGNDRLLWVNDLMTGQSLIPAIIGHSGRVLAVTTAELHGEPVVVSGSADQSIRVWHLSGSAEDPNPFTGWTRSVRALATARVGGRAVAVTGDDAGTVRAWDLATGVPATEALKGHRGAVNAAAVATRGEASVAVTGGADGTVRAWDLSSGAEMGEPFTGHAGPVKAVAVAQLHRRPVVVSGGTDWTVRVSHLGADLPLGSPFTSHTGAVLAVATGWFGDRPVAVSGSADSTVRMWDLSTMEAHGAPLSGHTGSVNAVAILQRPGGPVVVSAGDDATVRLWDPVTREARVLRLSRKVSAVMVAERHGRPVVVAAGEDQRVAIWDVETGQECASLFWRNGNFLALVPAELDGRRAIVAASDDFTVRLWDIDSGEPMGDPFVGHFGWVSNVVVVERPGGPVLVSGGEEGRLAAWDLAGGAPLGGRFAPYIGAVGCLAAGHLNGRDVVVSGHLQSKLVVWDVATGSMIGEPVTELGPVLAVAWSEGFVVCGGEDAVRVWDPGTRSVVDAWEDTGVVRALAAAGGRVLAGSEDGSLLALGHWRMRLHVGAVRALAVAPGGIVVSCGADRTIRLWDAATGTPVGGLPAWHTDWVNALAVGEVDRRAVLASGSDDQTVRVAWLGPGPSPEPWRQIDLGAQVLSVAMHGSRLVAGTARGIVVLDLEERGGAALSKPWEHI